MEDSKENQYAALAHVISFVGFVIPLGSILGPLGVYIWKKESSVYVREQAAHAFNFQLTLLIVLLLVFVPILVMSFSNSSLHSFDNIFALMAFYVLVVAYGGIFTVIATIRASNGVNFSYPATVRFIS